MKEGACSPSQLPRQATGWPCGQATGMCHRGKCSLCWKAPSVCPGPLWHRVGALCKLCPAAGHHLAESCMPCRMAWHMMCKCACTVHAQAAHASGNTVLYAAVPQWHHYGAFEAYMVNTQPMCSHRVCCSPAEHIWLGRLEHDVLGPNLAHDGGDHVGAPGVDLLCDALTLYHNQLHTLQHRQALPIACGVPA